MKVCAVISARRFGAFGLVTTVGGHARFLVATAVFLDLVVRHRLQCLRTFVSVELAPVGHRLAILLHVSIIGSHLHQRCVFIYLRVSIHGDEKMMNLT